MITTLLVVQFVLAAFIILVVLLQKSSSIGLGAYSGSNESLFGAKGPNAFLAKATAVIGVLFVANTIATTYFYYNDRDASLVDSVTLPIEQSVPAVPEAPKE